MIPRAMILREMVFLALKSGILLKQLPEEAQNASDLKSLLDRLPLSQAPQTDETAEKI